MYIPDIRHLIDLLVEVNLFVVWQRYKNSVCCGTNGTLLVITENAVGSDPIKRNRGVFTSP